MKRVTRRHALKASATAVAAAALTPGHAPAFLRGRNLNDEIRIAVVGTGGRGGAHISGFSSIDGAKMVALCDADEGVVGRKADALRKTLGQEIARVLDFRDVLDRDDIDVVTFATPNHWHALMTILACEAGKHVYVEKPVCHTIWEGRQMVSAMKKNGCVVGAGFQNRSDVGLMKAIPQIHEGRIGKITMARGLCYRNRASIGKRETPLTPPNDVDYNLWLGPAADVPIMRPKFHYDWHWVFNTGNGDMGNQGPHEMDLLRWALGDPQHPQKVMSIGGRFGWDDAGDTPNMQLASFNFGDDVPVFFEVRNLHQKENSQVGRYGRGPGVGIIITGETGEFRGGRGGGAFYDNDGNKVEDFKGDSGRGHMRNFLDAVRIEDASGLRSPVESAFYSSCMSHLANISVRVGRDADGDEVRSAVSGNDVASEIVDRFAAQLDLWKVDTKKTPWHIGPELTFDSEKELFTDGEDLDAANGLVKREDRRPFVVPEISV